MTEKGDINKLAGREVIFEMRPVGAIMRVAAMDVATMTEVTIQGPLNAGDAVLKQNALMRLAYVLKKEGKIS